MTSWSCGAVHVVQLNTELGSCYLTVTVPVKLWACTSRIYVLYFLSPNNSPIVIMYY